MPSKRTWPFARLITPLVAGALAGVVRDGVAAPLQRQSRARGVATSDYDPLNPRTAAQPHEAYRQLLAGPPVHYLPKRNLWVITHYDAVKQAARDADLLVSGDGIVRYRTSLPTMLTRDEPTHGGLRKLGIPSFTKQAMQTWTATIDGLVQEQVAELHAHPGTDVIDALAVPLPVKVIAMMLGVPTHDHENFRKWSTDMVRLTNIELTPTSLAQLGTVLGATARLHSYLSKRFDSGELTEHDNALTRALAATEEGELSYPDLFFFTALLLLAGNETTTNMIGTLFHNLATNPDQYDALRADPTLIPAAIEEQIRHSSPIQGFYRTARVNYDVEGVTIPACARVLLSFGAANRDPRRFENPDQFVVTRENNHHLGFGHGLHLCLGSRLARAEGIAVLEELVRTTQKIELTGLEVWTTNSSLRGIAHMPVALKPI